MASALELSPNSRNKGETLSRKSSKNSVLDTIPEEDNPKQKERKSSNKSSSPTPYFRNYEEEN